MPPEQEGPRVRTVEPRAAATALRQRRQLLDAMTAVAGERGWEQTTLRAVVGRAGLSRRTLYDLFADKQQCFLAAADETIERASTRVLDACGEAGTPREGLARAVDELLRFCAEEPAAARVYLVETAVAGQAGAERWEAHMEAMSDRAARALGGLRPNLPPHAGSMAVGGVYTVARTRVLAGRARQLPELGPELTRSLWLTLGID